MIHKLGDAYKHHQPGCAERAHRSILEQAKTILLASKLPVIFYTAALEYSTYIINRIPRVGQSWRVMSFSLVMPRLSLNLYHLVRLCLPSGTT